MLDNLKELFKESVQYTHTAGVIQQISNLLNIINSQYMKQDGKNAAIDLICELLQGHKDVPAPAEEQTTQDVQHASS